MPLYLFYEEETEAPEGKGLAQGLTAIKWQSRDLAISRAQH